MNRQVLLTLLVVVLLVLAGVWLLSNQGLTTPGSGQPMPTSGSESSRGY